MADCWPWDRALLERMAEYETLIQNRPRTPEPAQEPVGMSD